MTSSNGHGERGPAVTSLRDLPHSIEPPRDLWPQIEARLKAEIPGDGRARRAARWRGPVLALAATIASLAVGIWIGRDLLPGAGPRIQQPVAAVPGTGAPAALRAALRSDSRYVEKRAELLRTLESRLAQLPPESRANVMASLEAIRQSMRELEAALGRDPSNALLQELLVNTYQDEMRVLVAIHEAGAVAGEI